MKIPSSHNSRYCNSLPNEASGGSCTTGISLSRYLSVHIYLCPDIFLSTYISVQIYLCPDTCNFRSISFISLCQYIFLSRYLSVHIYHLRWDIFIQIHFVSLGPYIFYIFMSRYLSVRITGCTDIVQHLPLATSPQD